MEQATQPTTTTPTETVEQDRGRTAYERARALADRLVAKVQVLPTSVDIHRYLTADAFAVRLHFGTGLDAGRGVLAAATLLDADVLRDDQRHDVGWGGVVWIETQTIVDGIEVLARALTNTEDADALLPPPTKAPAETPGEVTQPMPTVSTDPATAVVPAITPVLPLSAKTTAAVAQDDEARCVKCGCTEDAACDGGCYWVPNEQMVDLCSTCATPQQLAAMVFAPVSSASARAGGK